MGKAVLYLDFDGVLHPDQVYLVRGKAQLGLADDATMIDLEQKLARLAAA